MTIDLNDEGTTALARLLTKIIGSDRFPLSTRLQFWQRIFVKRALLTKI